MIFSGRSFNYGGVIVTTVRQAFVAVLLGLWAVVCAGQETAEEAVAESAAQLESVPEEGSAVADDMLNEIAAEQGETSLVSDESDTAQVETEIAPLDEQFIPSEDVPICYERISSRCEGRPFPVDI